MARVEHHAALPYAEIGAFMDELRQRDGVAARALEYLVLTAARTGEVLGARWEEINIAERVWTVPAERMKAGKEHRVPLSDQAMAIVSAMGKLRVSPFVFPGGRDGALGNMAMRRVVELMGRDVSVHGFRSTFRDWAAEVTAYPRDVAEAALAHGISDKVEAAYRRGDLFDKRRRLMDAWALHCALSTATGGVVPISARAARA